jgi:hypothetical protein
VDRASRLVVNMFSLLTARGRFGFDGPWMVGLGREGWTRTLEDSPATDTRVGRTLLESVRRETVARFGTMSLRPGSPSRARRDEEDRTALPFSGPLCVASLLE